MCLPKPKTPPPAPPPPPPPPPAPAPVVLQSADEGANSGINGAANKGRKALRIDLTNNMGGSSGLNLPMGN